MAITDLFSEAHKKEIAKTKEQFFEVIKTDENFVGHLYDLDYDTTNVLVNDHHKNAVKGVPHGCFLMAIYTNEIVGNKTEGILLRVIGVADIPQKKASADYFKDFRSIDMFDESDDREVMNARDRKRAIYKCILYMARFEQSPDYKLKFDRFTLKDSAKDKQDKEKNKPHEGITIKEACKYFENLDFKEVNDKYQDDKQYQALLKVFQAKSVSGYRALMDLRALHSLQGGRDYKKEIDSALREGKIVLVDLSTASSQTQEKYIERLCRYIFGNSMEKFTNEETPDYIQMYFEEAHNIFPKDDKDLTNIYNRLAKEGAKLKIGISYSTQEVSSIAPSILKNTQNWFISHLNNKDEVKTLEKYYDFADFSQSIIRNSDVGFARVKLFSNNFIIPVQIDKFEV